MTKIKEILLSIGLVIVIFTALLVRGEKLVERHWWIDFAVVSVASVLDNSQE